MSTINPNTQDPYGWTLDIEKPQEDVSSSEPLQHPTEGITDQIVGGLNAETRESFLQKIEGLEDLVNSMMGNIEELKRQIIQTEAEETTYQSLPELEENPVPIIDTFKNDENISQWRHEYPQGDNTQQQLAQEKPLTQEPESTPQAPLEVNSTEIDEDKRKREIVLKLRDQASTIITPPSTDTLSNISES